ncbi:MAG TPA: signal peptide peptidase SppA [Candidatus Binatia bacterium]|nr:signal peptide peptidase SppA [Candidatus Binatia bacterium]
MAVKRWLVGCIVLVVGTLATVTLAFLVVNLSLENEGLALGPLGKRVGLVEIIGDIESSDGVVDQLEHMRLDSSVRAVVLRLDSPGGGVAASQEIYEAVRKVRDEGKPVIASMGGVAASGAYYIACAADSIVSNPGTLTGSIGVIMSFPNTEELFKKVGVRFEVVKTGKFKDIGSLSRPMTPDEKALLQGVLSNVYQQFVTAISDGRDMEKGDILPYADGRIFSGDQARDLGFVDRLGDLNDAIQLAGTMAGIKGRPVVVRKERRRVSVLDLFQDKLRLVPGLSEMGPRLEYRLR